MRKTAFGGWAVRFLAAAGVSSIACSGSEVTLNPGAGNAAGRNVGGENGAGANGDGTGLGGSPGAGAADPGVGAGPPGSQAGSATSDPNAAGSNAGGADVGAGAGSSSGGEPGDFDPTAPRFACTSPQPYLNEETGFEVCANGMLHRAKVGECLAGGAGSCQVDEDCGPTPTGQGTICRCDPQGVGVCVAASCSTDADCDEGLACLGTISATCSYEPDAFIFSCAVPDDHCFGGGCNSVTDQCVSFGDGFSCVFCQGAAGRPFLIDAIPRIAATVPSSDWLDGDLALSAPALTSEMRVRLSAHWQRQAELEHASVAAFARFVLELLSLGAPPDLVTAATAALADETAHARACYAVASSYAERPLGPSGLDLSGALGELGLQAIVTRAVLEGCVGETLAAIEASEAASQADDSAIRQLLSRIAEDEARHAELSWRFLRWALSGGDVQLRGVVHHAFEGAKRELLARSASAPSGGADAELLAHGVLPAPFAARLLLDAFDAVIAPCAAALLSAVPASRPLPVAQGYRPLAS